MVGVTPSSIMVFSYRFGLKPRAAAALTEECPIAPSRPESRLIVRSGALAHLPHLFREGFLPGQAPRELARRSRLEEKAVAARLDQLGERADAARDHCGAVRKGFEELPRHRLVGK